MDIKSIRDTQQDGSIEQVKKQSRWSPEEDAKIIQLRQNKMEWEDISDSLPGRSAISCSLHYQNYLEKDVKWDENSKTRLAMLYGRFRKEMWSEIAKELCMPWRTVEAMHWEMGERELAQRAGGTSFSDRSRQNARGEVPMLPGVKAMLSGARVLEALENAPSALEQKQQANHHEQFKRWK